MSTPDYPAVVERYKRFRALGRQHIGPLFGQLSKRAFEECGRKLGMLRGDTLVLGEEHEGDVFMDYCIYDYYEDGMNAVARYIAQHRPDPDSDLGRLFQAAARARYTLVQVRRRVEGVGVWVFDLMDEREFFLADIGFGKTAVPGLRMAGRILPLGDFEICSGAGLPVDGSGYVKIVMLLGKRLGGVPERFAKLPPAQKADLTGEIIRICLASDAASRIRYEDV